MKTKLKIIITFIALISCVACTNNTKDLLLSSIKEKGVLVVATSPDWPPYEFIDTSKSGQEQYVGADIELAKYIAEKLEVDLEILPADFNTALAAVATKKADIIISGVGYKEDRLEAMDFTKTYNPTSDSEDSFQGIMMKSDIADNYTTLEAFSNLSIGAQLGSLQEGFVKEQIKDANLVNIKDIGTGIVMLQNGKIDALAITSTTGSQYIEANPDLKMAPVKFAESELADYDGTVIGVQKGEKELVDFLNTLIDEIVESGIYDEWEIEYTEYAQKIGA